MPTANGNLPDPSEETLAQKTARKEAEARLTALAKQLADVIDKLPKNETEKE